MSDLTKLGYLLIPTAYLFGGQISLLLLSVKLFQNYCFLNLTKLFIPYLLSKFIDDISLFHLLPHLLS